MTRIYVFTLLLFYPRCSGRVNAAGLREQSMSSGEDSVSHRRHSDASSGSDGSCRATGGVAGSVSSGGSVSDACSNDAATTGRASPRSDVEGAGALGEPTTSASSGVDAPGRALSLAQGPPRQLSAVTGLDAQGATAAVGSRGRSSGAMRRDTYMSKDPWLQESSGSWSWAFASHTTVTAGAGTGRLHTARGDLDPLLNSTFGSTMGAMVGGLKRWHLWEGRATFLCGGRVMLGPDSGNVGVSATMIVVPWSLVTFLVYVLHNPVARSILHVLVPRAYCHVDASPCRWRDFATGPAIALITVGTLLFLSVVVSFVLAACTEPGV